MVLYNLMDPRASTFVLHAFFFKSEKNTKIILVITLDVVRGGVYTACTDTYVLMINVNMFLCMPVPAGEPRGTTPSPVSLEGVSSRVGPRARRAFVCYRDFAANADKILLTTK